MMTGASMKASAALILAFLVLIALVPIHSLASPAEDLVRVVVGYINEDVVEGIAKSYGTRPLKNIQEIKAAVIVLPRQAIKGVLRYAGVRYVEEDGVAEVLEFGSSPDVKWNTVMINATLVWDEFYELMGWSSLGYGVTVAILDTGIYYRHPDLKGRVSWCANTVGTKTYMGNDLSKCADKNGHGTHVAGIVAAQVNGFGSAGVSPNVTLYAVKVLNDAGYGTYSDIAEGITLAVKGPDGLVGTADDARVLSMSLGGSTDSQVLRDAAKWAYDMGSTLVAAAGNSGDGNPSTDNVAYPARYEWVIAVAAVDQHYGIPSWSSDGPEVDVAAPGVNVYSTYKNNKYATLSGTSMATPHVSAVVALIQALRLANNERLLTPKEIYDVITTTAKDIGPSGLDVYSGYGLIDAYAAVQGALAS